jgi:DNA integrity scanning protein DisA with diadenylate cyclase activity
MQKSIKIRRALIKAHTNINELVELHEKQFKAAQEQLEVATNEAALYQYGLQVGDMVVLKTNENTKLKILSFHSAPNIAVQNMSLYHIFARTTIHDPNKPNYYYPKVDYLCDWLTKTN